jgi:20S proteasome alpha/beta subunit
MTIAIGLRSNDGIVLAADSQETLAGYIKGETGKIKTIIFASGTVLAIVGSGHSDYIETATEKVSDGIGELKNFPDIKNRLEENLLAFFDKHLARFPENERPAVDLLIGMSMRPSLFALFHYSGTAFYTVSQKAIGAGILLANGLLSDFASGELNVDESASIAVYILSKVKRRVDTCGGFTDLVALRTNGDFALTDWKPIEKLEDEFEGVERRMIGSLRKEITAIAVPLSWHSEHRKKKSNY